MSHVGGDLIHRQFKSLQGIWMHRHVFLSSFKKGKNFYDFLFPFLEDKLLQTGSTHKEEMFLRDQMFSQSSR